MKDVVLNLHLETAMRLITDKNDCNDLFDCMTRR